MEAHVQAHPHARAMSGRALLALAATALATLAAAASASAATLTLDRGWATYAAAPGEANDLTITQDNTARTLTFDDAVAVSVVGAGCSPAAGDATKVVC